MTGPAPRRIGVLYPSGWGNLGDEAVLQATFAGLRQLWPDAELKAFTLHPARTSVNHRVSAEPLTGLNRPLFCAPRDDEPGLVRVARSVARRTSELPLLWRFTRWAADRTADIVFETKSVISARRWLKNADLLLASGGGQLDDVWGGAFGQPYALARWAYLSKRARVPFAFLSVGYGGASGWLSRRFLRYALSQSAYCSLRDAGSLALTQRLGVKRDLGVVPDLAFALASRAPLPRKRPGFDVGVSPMTYMRPGSWPNANPEHYRRLVRLWADTVAAIVAKGNRAHLFVSAPEDMVAVDDVLNSLDDETRAACTKNQAASPDELLEFYRCMDVVISSRLHGVLLAMVAGRPVLALSHERKVRALMTDAGVAHFCSELDSATVDQTMDLLEKLTGDLVGSAFQVRDYASRAASRVRQQQMQLPQLAKSRP